MNREEILVAFSAGASPALGNIWRITAKKTDFYLDPFGQTNAFHLSVHGPNDSNPDGHRFHLRADRHAAAIAVAQGDFILHNIPRKGFAFDGQKVGPGAFRVARIRWLRTLQRPRFRGAAALPGPLPDIEGTPNRSAARLSSLLAAGQAADLDLVVSYDGPFWPNGEASLRDNSRLGPLRNEAGMWLTGTSYWRSETTYPAPESLSLPVPRRSKYANRIMAGAPGQEGIYWFVEAITSRQFIEASQPKPEG